VPKLKRKTVVVDDFLPDTLRMASLAAEHKAKDLRAYDVRGLTVVADAFLLVTATSEPHFRAIFNAVTEGMKEVGRYALHKEGTFRGGWALLDYGGVVMHIFREEARAFYDLDGLWADAPNIDLEID
jgi:ribosome-associated protein